MIAELINYNMNGVFSFSTFDNLTYVCNAPKAYSGIYLIFNGSISESNLIYIGISGREGKSGEIIHRKDGISGRITKGKQFGTRRSISWPRKMLEDGIDTIIVKWWVTYGEDYKDFPRPIERELLINFTKKHGSLPLWNNEI